MFAGQRRVILGSMKIFMRTDALVEWVESRFKERGKKIQVYDPEDYGEELDEKFKRLVVWLGKAGKGKPGKGKSSKGKDEL